MGESRARLSPQLVAGGSLAVDCFLVAAKLAAGLLTGSLALLGDAVHSGLDLVASGFALVAVRASSKPADREHPYGHGRAENLAAFGEGVILAVAALAIAYNGARRLLGEPAPVDPAWFAIGLMAGTIVLELGRSTVLRRSARRWSSAALHAGAQNRRSDVLSAAGVLAGLIGVKLGLVEADAVAALLVAALILRAAAVLTWRSGDILIDRAPGGVEEAVRRTIAGVEGVREVRAVRVRGSGPRLIGDAHVTARPTLTVEGAHRLSEQVLAAVGARHPDLDLALVVEGQAAADNLVERVHAVAERGGSVRDLHNVTVERERDGSLHLSMHAKLPGEMSLEAAAREAGCLEADLRREFPGVSRVDVHLEPLEPDLVPGRDVTVAREDLAGRIRDLVQRHPAVHRCRDVELSARGHRLVAHVVAEMPGGVSLERAHAVETELEEALRAALPEVDEVVARVTP